MRIEKLKKVKSLCFFLLIVDDNCQVLDKSLQSIGLKDAVADLKEVAKDMKETSFRMQNATLLFLEGQKGQEFKMNKHKNNEERRNRKACKRFRWNRFKHLKCLGRKGRSQQSNVTSKHVHFFFFFSILTI